MAREARVAGRPPGTIHLNVASAPLGVTDDDDVIPCCDGSAMSGPTRCTCWTPVHDLEQAPVQEGPMERRVKCCHDCAYLQGSPEREAGDGDWLEGLPTHNGMFVCHQGMRRAVAYRHPDGRELPAGEGDYDPPIRGTQAWRADGRPAQLCAGWAAIGEARA